MTCSTAQGHAPLPPYITHALPPGSRERYQTVYAAQDGSAAAPTAGLHFTPALLARIEERGVQIAQVTLHVGLGTFRPIETDDITAPCHARTNILLSRPLPPPLSTARGAE